MPNEALKTIFLRLGLAAGFASAVADRLGVWGPYGKQNVAWGDMEHFLSYTARLNPWLPFTAIPAVGWAATIAEIALAVLLFIGLQTRWTARLSGWLLLAFALGMTLGTGVKTAFDASVFAASGGAFMLATASRYALSVDQVISRSSNQRQRTRPDCGGDIES